MYLKKLILLILFLSLVSPAIIYSKSLDLNFDLRGIELSYGAYDMMLAADINLLDMEYLSYKPNLRYNPFVNVLRFGLFAEYYPLNHFDVGFWLFNDSDINPYVLLGFQLPINFSAFSIPLGLGIQYEALNDFYIGFRFYGDFMIAPIGSASATWDFTFEYKL